MERNEYIFYGMEKVCGKNTPHHPHKIGSYDTVRWGELSYFCGGHLAPNECYEKYIYSQGCACTPTKLKCTILTFSSKEEKEEWEKVHPDRDIQYLPRHEGSCA